MYIRKQIIWRYIPEVAACVQRMPLETSGSVCVQNAVGKGRDKKRDYRLGSFFGGGGGVLCGQASSTTGLGPFFFLS